MRLDDVIPLLRSLRQETTWRHFELPAEFTDDVLVRLFEAGFIQIHLWCKDGSGKPVRLTFGSRGGWIGDSGKLGAEGLLARLLSNKQHQGERAPEFQLSEKGWMAMRDAENASAAGGGNRNRRLQRGRRQSANPKACTDKQVEAMQLVGEHKGNIAAAARAAGVDRKTMAQHYAAACKKIGQTAVSKKPKPSSLPHDNRGQVNVDRDNRDN